MSWTRTDGHRALSDARRAAAAPREARDELGGGDVGERGGEQVLQPSVARGLQACTTEIYLHIDARTGLKDEDAQAPRAGGERVRFRGREGGRTRCCSIHACVAYGFGPYLLDIVKHARLRFTNRLSARMMSD